MINKLIGAVEILTAFAMVGACAPGPEARLSRVATAPVRRMVPVSPGVALEVVDWGGRGTPLVFLAGGGNTAHVFDGFAPQFTDRFHVVGITRRGFGASASAPPPDNLDTLVADVAAVLDSLELGKVVFVGHSIAGEEMTRFTERYGARCAGLVYLDAAYDRSGIDTLSAKQPFAPAPRISAPDTASFSSLRALYARAMGVEEPESEIRATERFDAAVNFPWLVVEPEGQRKAGDWTAVDQGRLEALVRRAHAQNLWIRFYTLDGFLNGDGDGLTQSYDFGSDAAVKVRWRAAIEAGVDFIATDHYERFDAARRERSVRER